LNSDSLLRHLAKHGVFKPSPSGRSKRACVTCHAGKTKCDGNERCATCVKKGIECRYRSQDDGAQISISPVESGDQANWQSSTSPKPSAREQEPAPSSSYQAAPLASNSQSQRPPLSLTGSSQFWAPGTSGLVDWSAVKIRTDSNAQNTSRTQAVDPDVSLDAVSTKYLDLYYARFHHRWPIIHRPSLEEETPVSIVLSSMTMIGAWLEGTQQAKTRALNSHEQLVSEALSQLVRIQHSHGALPDKQFI
jgi:Fungal Zn(2)-Cys(6) binuclear cluster domain/Fungal specific transcription factor domain